jgi:bis(5'-nucleosidyl)-tetraphosphatase
MEPEIFSSGFLLFRRQNGLQFLLMKHADRWDLPKGHLDPGETKQEAALRELSEETGLDADDIWIDPEFVFENRYWVSYKRTDGKKKLKELTIYLGMLRYERDITTTEHLGHAWINWAPPHHIQIETIDPLLKKVHEHLDQKRYWPPATIRE